MQVKATTSFVGLGRLVQKGQLLDLPDGADWLLVGLVELVTPETVTPEVETPEDQMPPVERAVTARQRRAK